MLTLHPIPAFNDNYIWCLYNRQSQEALVVDPGDAKPVEDFLASEGLNLVAILLTHHHHDHTGGIALLREHWACEVYGSVNARFNGVTKAFEDDAEFSVLEHRFKLLEVPGHTLDHVAFYAEAQAQFDQGILFSGDTLFSGGCGRLFEGSPEQMLSSLERLAALPASTLVCCAHEYTLANLSFARHVDPDNEALASYQNQCQDLRQQAQPTLPSTIARECAINPFLRSALMPHYAAEHCADPQASKLTVFTALRQHKDNF